MFSLSSTARRLVVAGLVSASLATSLAGCATASSGDASASREASLFRASRLCVINGTDYTFPSVGEYEMTRTGSSNPDPKGPLAPGARWCTNGYNAFDDSANRTVDATVSIVFSDIAYDEVHFEVGNPAFSEPWMRFGRSEWSNPFLPGLFDIPYEIDVTAPLDTLSGPKHDVHLRRADDSSNYIEWIVTVRS